MKANMNVMICCHFLKTPCCPSKSLLRTFEYLFFEYNPEISGFNRKDGVDETLLDEGYGTIFLRDLCVQLNSGSEHTKVNPTTSES